jgi:hypothetical protein
MAGTSVMLVKFDADVARLLGSGACLAEPERLVFPPPWVGHIPFAFWLIESVRPDCLVELGTHSGNSYCAFLQAAVACNLPLKAYAVDTWKGDAHAGFYGEEVFASLAEYHDGRYGGFSRLMRMTFDEARDYFSDSSVDLLHIDGHHAYESVKRDFENWLPKMSRRGVVLFHDTNVRERDFGVWRLWEEVSSRYPSFSFCHSHGLGLAYVGEAPMTEDLRWLIEEPGASSGRLANVRNLFARLGRGFDDELWSREYLRRLRLCQAEIKRLKGQAHGRGQEAAAVAARRRWARAPRP